MFLVIVKKCLAGLWSRESVEQGMGSSVRNQCSLGGVHSFFWRSCENLSVQLRPRRQLVFAGMENWSENISSWVGGIWEAKE